MTLIYQVGDEVFLSAPRDVLEEVIGCIEYSLDQGFYGNSEHMVKHLRLFATSLRAHSQHLPEPVKTEGWLDT